MVSMDPNIRDKLQVLLGEYIVETVTHIETVRDFCEQESNWTIQRDTEFAKMIDIKERADQISLTFDHVKKSENKAKAFGEYLKSGLTQVTAGSRRRELEKKLGEVLNETLIGLEKLQHFLDSIEKLAVTSLFVFNNQSLMPTGVSFMDVQSVISTARTVSTKLVHFKRDAGAFFLPSLSNVDVLAFQLGKYIHVTQELCEKWRSVSFSGGVPQWENNKPALNFTLNMSEKSVQKLYDHLNQLNKIRMDESFRLTFMFNKDAQRFIGIFSQRSSRMFQFLSDLEENAVQLDRMKLGSNISTVAGSSVGIAGGVLSIVGLALTPVTAGVSLALTATGIGLGVTSGVNSLVTGITELAVNRHHGENANNTFTKFMEDVEKLQDCMEHLESIEVGPDGVRTTLEAGKVIARAGLVARGIDVIADGASVMKAARAGTIALNALFIGLDVMFICKDSVSLAKGSKSEAAELIRNRSVLWRSEVEAWRKIHDLLCKGIWKYRNNQKILEQPFYP